MEHDIKNCKIPMCPDCAVYGFETLFESAIVSIKNKEQHKDSDIVGYLLDYPIVFHSINN